MAPLSARCTSARKRGPIRIGRVGRGGEAARGVLVRQRLEPPFRSQRDRRSAARGRRAATSQGCCGRENIGTATGARRRVPRGRTDPRRANRRARARRRQATARRRSDTAAADARGRNDPRPRHVRPRTRTRAPDLRGEARSDSVRARARWTAPETRAPRSPRARRQTRSAGAPIDQPWLAGRAARTSASSSSSESAAGSEHSSEGTVLSPDDDVEAEPSRSLVFVVHGCAKTRYRPGVKRDPAGHGVGRHGAKIDLAERRRRGAGVVAGEQLRAVGRRQKAVDVTRLGRDRVAVELICWMSFAVRSTS